MVGMVGEALVYIKRGWSAVKVVVEELSHFCEL